MDGRTLLARKNDPSCKLPSPLNPIPTDPIVGSKDFYHVNVIVSGALAIFSISVTFALIWRHITHMSRPREQIYIIRICLLLPIIAAVFWVGVYIPRYYVYTYAIVVFCEPVTLMCFFLFICETLAAPVSGPALPTPPSRRDVFLSPLVTRARLTGGSVTDKSLFNPFRFNWYGIAQNVPIIWAVAIAIIATEAAGVYCLTAHDAHHAHIYLIVFKTISTFAALLYVLREVLPVRSEVKKHRAMAKLWGFKALIFLQVSQDFIFSIIDSRAPRSITESTKISQVDFITGVPALVAEIELVVFSVFFHYAYSVSVYRLSDEQKRAGEHYKGYGWRLIYKVFDIRDIFALILFPFRIREEVVSKEEEMQTLETRENNEGSPERKSPYQHSIEVEAATQDP
ncbi:hypothetical protein RRF57_006220 [Xylaria bambusicola]|uniref:Organic solute transporter Ostalpha-domain-containing protein n=1 Tax=Xylaria bambusicola TaxID=326684 RepID=A0AAN7UDY1_9PEZI